MADYDWNPNTPDVYGCEIPANSSGYSFGLNTTTRCIDFAFIPSVSKTIDKFHICLKKNGTLTSAANYLKVDIYTDAEGAPSDTILSSGQIAHSAITYGWNAVDMANQALTAGTLYHAVIYSTYATSANHLQLMSGLFTTYQEITDEYVMGGKYTYSAGSWVTDPQWQTYFKQAVASLSVPERYLLPQYLIEFDDASTEGQVYYQMDKNYGRIYGRYWRGEKFVIAAPTDVYQIVSYIGRYDLSTIGASPIDDLFWEIRNDADEYISGGMFVSKDYYWKSTSAAERFAIIPPAPITLAVDTYRLVFKSPSSTTDNCYWVPVLPCYSGILPSPSATYKDKTFGGTNSCFTTSGSFGASWDDSDDADMSFALHTTLPSAPTNCTLTSNTSTARNELAWEYTGDDNHLGFYIYRLATDDDDWKLIKTLYGDVLSWSDPSAAAGTSYAYAITRFDNRGLESNKTIFEQLVSYAVNETVDDTSSVMAAFKAYASNYGIYAFSFICSEDCSATNIRVKCYKQVNFDGDVTFQIRRVMSGYTWNANYEAIREVDFLPYGVDDWDNGGDTITGVVAEGVLLNGDITGTNFMNAAFEDISIPETLFKAGEMYSLVVLTRNATIDGTPANNARFYMMGDSLTAGEWTFSDDGMVMSLEDKAWVSPPLSGNWYLRDSVYGSYMVPYLIISGLVGKNINSFTNFFLCHDTDPALDLKVDYVISHNFSAELETNFMNPLGRDGRVAEIGNYLGVAGELVWDVMSNIEDTTSANTKYNKIIDAIKSKGTWWLKTPRGQVFKVILSTTGFDVPNQFDERYKVTIPFTEVS